MSSRQIDQKILAGDTYKVVFNARPYSSVNGFNLTLMLTGPSGTPQKSAYAANANPDSEYHFDIRISPTESAALAAGIYSYAVVANDAIDQFTLESGTLNVEVRADLSAETDLRSHNVKVYQAICAVIEGRASQDQQSYTIAGRQLTRTPLRDLLDLKKHYKELVDAEAGKPGSGPTKLYVRIPHA